MAVAASEAGGNGTTRRLTLLGSLLALAARPSWGADLGSGGITALSGALLPTPAKHPFVFTTTARLSALLDRRATPVVAAALSELTRDVDAILASPGRVTTVVTGNDLMAYLNGFSLSPQGAAPSMLRLALYAMLTSLHGGFGATSKAAAAQSLCGKAIAAWSEGGFVDQGRALTSATQFTLGPADPSNNTAQRDATTFVGLQLGRGMIPFTLALDLLLGLATPPPIPASAATGFIERALSLVVESAQAHATQPLACGRYDNQTSLHVLATLVMARFLGDTQLMQAMAGLSTTRPLSFSWPLEVDRAIYAVNDAPRACFDAAATKPGIYRQTAVTAPGEIVDRFRAEPYQPFGYTLGSLTSMLLGARVLENAGFGAAKYSGPNGQSPGLALRYYGFYLSHFLSTQQMSLPVGAVSYPDYAQYAGDPFTRGGGASVENKDQILTPFILGMELYPNDPTLNAVIAKARSFPGITPFFAIDPVCIDALSVVAR